MGKSMLTIHKEIEQKEYDKTPLGQLEKKLKKFYNQLKEEKKKLSETVSKEIYDIRDQHEKDQLAYIEKSHKENREMVDKMLFEAMQKELLIIEKHNGTI